jgi:hypothetical protein
VGLHFSLYRAKVLSIFFSQSIFNHFLSLPEKLKPEFSMADVSRTRRNTLERRCLPKYLKRLFKGSNKTIFKMLEKVKK